MNTTQAIRSTIALAAGAAITIETMAIPIWARAACAAVIAAATAAHIPPSKGAAAATSAIKQDGPWT